MDTTVQPPEPRYIGKRVTRREDPRFLRGVATYVGDLSLSRMIHASFVRSHIPHGILKDVNTQGATELVGEKWVLTGDEILGKIKPLRADSLEEGWQGSSQHALAVDRVRYVGEPVACVVAKSRYQAEDAAELIYMDVEPLDAMPTIENALADDAALIHEDWNSNCFSEKNFETPNFSEALDACDNRLTLQLELGRHSGVPLETRACLADWDAGQERLTLWLTSQIPLLARTKVAELLGLRESRVRVISPDVGGGFGVKAYLYPEELVCAYMSMKLARPVKWVEDRTEHMMASIHAREHRHQIEVGFSNDGQIIALDVDLQVNCGAYSTWPMGASMEAGMALGIFPGPYTIKDYRAHMLSVCTNKTPAGAYRGVARPGACFGIERTIDAVARALKLEPTEVRRRNLVKKEQFPYTSVTGLEYDSGSFLESLDVALERFGYDHFREKQARVREEGRYLGLGVTVYTEQTAHTFEEFKRRNTAMTFGYETATIRMDPSGEVVVNLSTHSHGQGHETTMAQLVADQLALPMDRISVRFGDTDSVVYGNGTFASRSAVLAGGASHKAAVELREKLGRIAAHALEIDAADLEMSDGRAQVRGAPERSIDYRDIASWTYLNAQRIPPGEQPSLEVTATYDAEPGRGTFTNAALIATVEVDVETGGIDLLRFLVVEDCGRMINPMVVDGQIHGGTAQGIGSALFEEFLYGSDGQIQSTTFMDYLIPSSTDLPNIETYHLETPSSFTINGLKGMGEGGAIGPGAVIACAVDDALASLGAKPVRTLPMSPPRIRALFETENSMD